VNDDPFPSSLRQLSRAPTATRVCACLIITIAVLSGLAGTFELMRAMQEPDAYVERVCARAGDSELADFGKRGTCLRRAHAGAPWSAASGYWAFASLAVVGGVVLIVVDARREEVG
jgi:hypothetical protein